MSPIQIALLLLAVAGVWAIVELALVTILLWQPPTKLFQKTVTILLLLLLPYKEPNLLMKS